MRSDVALSCDSFYLRWLPRVITNTVLIEHELENET